MTWGPNIIQIPSDHYRTNRTDTEYEHSDCRGTCTIRMMDFVEFIGDGKPVEIRYRLHNTVRYDIYEYMIG